MLGREERGEGGNEISLESAECNQLLDKNKTRSGVGMARRRKGRENRVSEDYSNINVPGRKAARRHSLIKKLEKLIHISRRSSGVVLLLA